MPSPRNASQHKVTARTADAAQRPGAVDVMGVEDDDENDEVNKAEKEGSGRAPNYNDDELFSQIATKLSKSDACRQM